MTHFFLITIWEKQTTEQSWKCVYERDPPAPFLLVSQSFGHKSLETIGPYCFFTSAEKEASPPPFWHVEKVLLPSSPSLYFPTHPSVRLPPALQSAPFFVHALRLAMVVSKLPILACQLAIFFFFFFFFFDPLSVKQQQPSCVLLRSSVVPLLSFFLSS